MNVLIADWVEACARQSQSVSSLMELYPFSGKNGEVFKAILRDAASDLLSSTVAAKLFSQLDINELDPRSEELSDIWFAYQGLFSPFSFEKAFNNGRLAYIEPKVELKTEASFTVIRTCPEFLKSTYPALMLIEFCRKKWPIKPTLGQCAEALQQACEANRDFPDFEAATITREARRQATNEKAAGGSGINPIEIAREFALRSVLDGSYKIVSGD